MNKFMHKRLVVCFVLIFVFISLVSCSENGSVQASMQDSKSSLESTLNQLTDEGVYQYNRTDNALWDDGSEYLYVPPQRQMKI